LMQRSKIPQKFLRWSNMWDMWENNLSELGVSPLEACLAYPLSLDQVDQVIVGVESAKQLEDIISAASSVDYALDTSFMSYNDRNLIKPCNWNHL